MSAPTPWWTTAHCLAFDCETTGVDTLNDRIVTAALVQMPHGRTPRPRTWLINPGVDIPDGAAAVHGITTAHAAEHGANPAVALEDLTTALVFAFKHGIPVVAANASFDLTILEAENTRHDVPTLAERLGGTDRIRPVLDPMVLDKQGQPYRKGPRKLSNLCTHYNVRLDDAHTADADALAAGLLWPAVLREHHHKLGASNGLQALHDSQVRWRAEHQTSLEEFHRRSGKASGTYDGGWPLHRAWTHPQLDPQLDGAGVA